MTVIFGYTHVSETRCRCGENYMMMEKVGEEYRMRCWCGATCKVTFDDQAELDAFVARYSHA